jgi:hypothetical protein
VRLYFIIVAIWFAAASNAFGASMAEVVGAFALNCMGQMDDRPRLQESLEQSGVKLKPEHADPLLKPDSGVAYVSKFDNGGQMIAGILDAGGCKIISKEADRGDVVKMLERFKPHIRVRLIATEPDGNVARESFTVMFRGKPMFLRILGPVNAAGAAVEILPIGRQPSGIPSDKIVWPD